jgi:hypothetical protein
LQPRDLNRAVIGHFTAHVRNARDLFQVNWRGEIAPLEQQTMFCCAVPVECTNTEKTVDVGFVLHIEAAIARVLNLEDRKRLASVAHHGAKEIIPRLAKYGPWNFYGQDFIRISGDTPLNKASHENALEFAEEVAPLLQEELVRATKRHADARAAFDRAKTFLESHLNGLHRYPTEAKSAARFLAQCMRNDASPYMGPWNDEKSAKLVGQVDDLIRRKNPNHPNYRMATERVRGVLYDIEPPTYWHNSPPHGGF